MPIERIQFGNSQETGHSEIGGASTLAMNVVVDGKGVVRRRPGIQAYSGSPSSVVDANGVVLVHETSGGELYVVGDGPYTRDVYRVTSGGTFVVTGGTSLVGQSRPTIAETEAMVVLAAGAEPLKVLFGGYASALGDAPPNGSHVIANSSRLLLNNVVSDKGQIAYSGLAAGSSIAGHEDWSSIAAGFFSAEARPDPVIALRESTSEVFAWGNTSCQLFAPDATTVYAPVSTIENGCAAPYSIIKYDRSFAWLDDRRRFVISDGRNIEVISSAIQQALNEMSAVSDCYGYRVHLGYVEAFVWTFPTDTRTFAYQVGGGWAQWGQFSAGNWQPFPVLSHFQRAGGAENLVGTTDGKVCVLQNGVADDLGDTIVTSVRTGFMDHKTSRKKRNLALRLTLKRGEQASPGPVGLLRWRDDFGGFSDSRQVYMGHTGESNPVVQLRALGTYRSRQWEFEFSGTTDYALASVEEEFEVLGV